MSAPGFLILSALTLLGVYLGRFRVLKISKMPQNPAPSSLLKYYGIYVALWVFIPGFLVMMASFLPLFSGLSRRTFLYTMMILSLSGLVYGLRRTQPSFRAREAVERTFKLVLGTSACLAILMTLGILISLLSETVRFFTWVPFLDFLSGTTWSPQTTFGPEDSIGEFGVLPLFSGTLLITGIAMIVALPVGLFIAIYTSEYASSRTRDLIKPIVEMLAGIPTIVYGFFAIVAVAPLLHTVGQGLNIEISSESALGVGLVMGVMILPFISSFSDDALRSVPFELRENSYALGATSSETIKKVVLPAAMPGIVAGVLLAVSRAIGETMLVVMAAGLTANFTANPLKSVTTLTVQIVTLLTGDQEFNSPKTLSAFALGLSLFIITLILNMIASRVVQRYRKKYGT